MWAGSLLFASQICSSCFPALIGDWRLPCVDCTGGLLTLWLPWVHAGWGNAGWKAEREIRVFGSLASSLRAPAPGHVLQPVWQLPAGSLLLFH